MQMLRLLALIISLGTTTARGADWPQWRGPDHNGISKETGWSTNIHKAWDKKVGLGSASMAVVGDRVYTMGFKAGNTTVYCLNARDGGVVWQKSYGSHAFAQMHKGGPGATPCVYQGKVYTVGRPGILHCYDAATGDILWEKNLTKEYGVKLPNFGFNGSVVVVDGKLILDIGRIVSMTPDGKTNWQSQNFGEAFSTPTPLTHGGQNLLAAFPKTGLVLVHADDGRNVASFDWKTQYNVHAASPVVGGNAIFIASGYGSGGAMVRLQGSGLTEVWRTKQMKNQMATCILHGGHLYGFDEEVLKCLDAETGERQWAERGLGKGALILADGKLIVQGGKGRLLIAPASPRGFSPLADVPAVPTESWAAPVLANGRIYTRDNEGHLVCFRASN